MAGYMTHLEWRPYTAADGTAPKTPPVRLWTSVVSPGLLDLLEILNTNLSRCLLIAF